MLSAIAKWSKVPDIVLRFFKYEIAISSSNPATYDWSLWLSVLGRRTMSRNFSGLGINLELESCLWLFAFHFLLPFVCTNVLRTKVNVPNFDLN